MSRVTFVNALRVPAEREREFVEKWDRGAAYVRSQPGLVWTSLHRNLDPSAPFQYFTIAVRESAEALAVATSTTWWQQFLAEFGFSSEEGGFGAIPALCEIVRSAPPFE